jgi:hypothetical protein
MRVWPFGVRVGAQKLIKVQSQVWYLHAREDWPTFTCGMAEG